ncbi:adenylate/guanylate cyclase domain-containing protein [Herpetosiphon sp.]|uniref:Adenylate/guanylate cyclase with Chase sensor n=1 Tax=Herpetosiphon aurantiacus (strain ATCC 23779 / DSM 785 / 114-95) TaxID=316274 RepID=A9AZ42_HERA2|nr:adenylate/guanylate cyclase domain-containing protein [Herpetosiphon sp.]ABX03588.1 adenylate/guanylate cyclase with Chase sensor [Herpetosiphon aurantiacus DSM 785]
MLRSQQIRRGIWFSATGLACLLALLLSDSWGWRRQLDRSAADLLVRQLASYSPQPAIIIVAIDDQALSNETGFGRLTEWDRSIYARLLDKLHAARVIVFDMLFTGANPAGDQAFTQALEPLEHPILAVSRDNQTNQIIEPASQLVTGRVVLAHSDIIADSDGVVRRIQTHYDQTALYPAIALASAQAWWHLPAGLQIEPTATTLTNGVVIPVNNSSFMLNYAGSNHTYPQVSLLAVLNGEVDPALFNDKIVLIGSTAAALGDRYTTPTSALMDGVEIHANAIGTILNANALREQSSSSRRFITLGLVLALTLIAMIRRPWLLFSGMVIGASVMVISAVSALQQQLLRIDLASPLLAIGLTGLVMLLVQNNLQRQDHTQVLELFAKRTPPSVLSELLKAAERGQLQLGGERREVSIVFMDMRGFTNLSERLPPEAMMQIINTYLNLIAKALIGHGGTLNQYAGDQAMAIFNAPVAQPDHAQRAIRGAVAALEAIVAFNRSAAAQALPAQASFGAGINTGIGVVGNVGAHERYDYSVIGDVTNVAARLCGAAPANTIYLGPDTLAEDLGDLQSLIQPMGALALKGKEASLEIAAIVVAE